MVGPGTRAQTLRRQAQQKQPSPPSNQQQGPSASTSSNGNDTFLTPVSSPQNITAASNNGQPRTPDSLASDANEIAGIQDGQHENTGTNLCTYISGSFILVKLL